MENLAMMKILKFCAEGQMHHTTYQLGNNLLTLAI